MHTGVMDVYAAGISTPHAAVNFNGKFSAVSVRFMNYDTSNSHSNNKTQHQIVVIEEFDTFLAVSLTTRHSTTILSSRTFLILPTFVCVDLFAPTNFWKWNGMRICWRTIARKIIGVCVSGVRCAKYRMAENQFGEAIRISIMDLSVYCSIVAHNVHEWLAARQR